jgi:hypothetical protein
MPVVKTGETEEEREQARWERPYQFQPFPTTLYRGILKANGKHDTESLIVHSERERAAMLHQGWVNEPGDALARLEQQEQDIATAAAENAAAAARMTGRAKRELQAREAATHRHVAE